MGYTHYWEIDRWVDLNKYRRALVEVGKVVKASPVPLGGPDGTGEPEVNGHILFNGKTPENFETFDLPAEPSPDCCKTGFTYIREYDVVIIACLCALADCLGADVQVTSDGNPSDWEPGAALASKALGHTVAVPPTVVSRG